MGGISHVNLNMNTKHTPAPWFFGHNVGVYAEGDIHIADISPSKNFDETLANAKLIAAAPELLEACIEVVKGYEGDGMENMQNRDNVFYEICKAAINKATL